MTGHELRDRFLRYFERNGHTRVRSSPLVPGNDPTLLFTNAGMVQFKARLPRRGAARLRARHDLPEVRAGGRQAQRPRERRPHRPPPHVLRDARQLLVRRLLQGRRHRLRLGVPHPGPRASTPRRLIATVFTDDDDAFALWKSSPACRTTAILRLGEKDNFWAMGDTGPCGPCSEVHFHQGDHLPCAEEAAGRSCLGPACECDRWLEIWNLVFMQFNRDAGGPLTPLPRPSIDTGMGLERIAAVMQGKLSSYETDLLRAAHRARRAPAGKRLRRRRGGRRLHARHRRPRARDARSSSPTACCPPTSGAATCCGGSCGGPCATAACSASPSRSCGR